MIRFVLEGQCRSWARWDSWTVHCMLAAGHLQHEERHAAEVARDGVKKMVAWRVTGEHATELEPPG